MKKYYTMTKNCTTLNISSGEALVIDSDFQISSSKIISKCNFAQLLIQKIIFTAHGSEIDDLKSKLKKAPNPKSRIDLLQKFPYQNDDPVVTKIFDYCRTLFTDLYEVRNILAHEVWSSSKTFPGCVLFSTIEDRAQLDMSSSKIIHKDSTKSKDVYDDIIKFISNVKIISNNHIELALSDMSLCEWMLMHVDTILSEVDESRKNEARQAFFVFRGTSHLFDAKEILRDPVTFSASSKKTIFG